MKLANSISEQNVYFTYVCLVNDIMPKNLRQPAQGFVDGNIDEGNQEDVPIKVERSKALHELIESHKNDYLIEERKYNESGPSSAFHTATSCDECETSENEDVINFDTMNPNVLKLTKMKWLSEEQEGSPNSNSPSISPTMSSTSTCSDEADDNLCYVLANGPGTVGDKCMSTILRLDKEHNMFGMSNIAIVGSRMTRKYWKEDYKPVFPQTAIVQLCCRGSCCRHRSKTDLPSSLKCSVCRGCCTDAFCPTCIGPCNVLPCAETVPCSFMIPCAPSKCMMNCTRSFGMKIKVNRKPRYDPTPIELTPRSSCVLDKPFAARSCHHLPHCVPPSSCFPYLMPCFWPARSSAPCSVPTQCFHNPPCLAPRKRKTREKVAAETCPSVCKDDVKKTTCGNMSCLGKSNLMKEALEKRYGVKK